MMICKNCRLNTHSEGADSTKELLTLCNPCSTLAGGDCSIRVSPLERGDLELVLAWRSHPEIYRHFRLQDEPLEWDEHVTWFESRSDDRYDFVIQYDNRRVGVISIDGNDEVGIYLGDFSAHGQGIATSALNWLCDRFNERTPLFAEVHKENDRSKKVFKRCGFQNRTIDDEWLKYSYDP